MVDDAGIDRECSLKISANNSNSTEIALKSARACKYNIDTCTRKNDRNAKFCKLYSSYLYFDDYDIKTVYKNSYCAACNNISISTLFCTQESDSTIGMRRFRTSLSVLFDFNVRSGQLVARTVHPCEPGSIFDSLRQRCLTIQCGLLYKLQNGECIRDETAAMTNNSLRSNCITVHLLPREFSLLPNDTVWVNATNKLYEIGEYELTDPFNASDSKLSICKEEHLVPLFKFSSAQSILSHVCLSISILCLIVHIALYAIVPKLRNLPGQNLLCLSGSLLLGQLLFLFGVDNNEHHLGCVCIGSILHFFLLSYFFWMNVMAIDICYTFRSNSYRPNAGRKRFIQYSCYAWLIPLGIVVLGAIFDHVEEFELSSFRPGYGNGLCWINHKKALIVLFIVPVAIIMILNISMFSLTAYHIKQSHEASKKAIKRSEKTRYILYIKLSIIMGLTWLFAFLAALVESEVTWYLFIIFNGLQGAFIFIAFSCKKKVFKLAVETVSGKSFSDSNSSSKDRKTITTSISSNSSKSNRNSESRPLNNGRDTKVSMDGSTPKVETLTCSSNNESNV
ncbi:G-protein coupled receptor Mth2 [Nymphon striatum]|nr:G-protein coupled receptor Mth2 [Nymphon striatum]